jgi:hypothetical protein
MPVRVIRRALGFEFRLLRQMSVISCDIEPARALLGVPRFDCLLLSPLADGALPARHNKKKAPLSLAGPEASTVLSAAWSQRL